MTSPRSRGRFATSPAVSTTRFSGFSARRMIRSPNVVAMISAAPVTTAKISATRSSVASTLRMLKPITKVSPVSRLRAATRR